MYNYQIYSIGSGFGYRLSQDNVVFKDQPFIPEIQGITPFASEEDATAAALADISILESI